MKNRINKTIKHLDKEFFLFIMATISVLVFSSCSGSKSELKKGNYDILVLDSCEYLYYSNIPYTSNFIVTHKGNCKFCRERNNKTLISK